jgi:hypothetical protein
MSNATKRQAIDRKLEKLNTKLETLQNRLANLKKEEKALARIKALAKKAKDGHFVLTEPELKVFKKYFKIPRGAIIRKKYSSSKS